MSIKADSRSKTSLPAQLGMFALFCLLIFSEGHLRWAIITCATLLICWAVPPARWLAMVAATCLFAGRSRILNQLKRQYPITEVLGNLQNTPSLRVSVFLLSAALCLAYRWGLRQLPENHFVRRHGFAVYFVYVFLITAILSTGGLPVNVSTPLWWIIYNLATLSPFVFYEIESIGTTEQYKGWRRLLFLRPFWQISFVAPIPRGAAELAQTEAKTPDAQVSLRMNAVRLLIWATALRGLLILLRIFVFDVELQPGLGFLAPYRLLYPGIFKLVHDPTLLAHISTPELWFIVIADFIAHFLQLAWRGHVIVSIVRMAGFHALRNTYRPLESTSLAQFFGRYNFHYKELLWRAFFFPSFRRFFRGNLRLRIATAVFLSVGLGNFLFLLTRDILLFSTFGVGGTLTYYAPYAVYCVTLSVAITLSMILSFGGSKKRPLWLRSVAVAGYILFFALLRIFDDTFVGNIEGNFAVLFHLFGA